VDSSLLPRTASSSPDAPATVLGRAIIRGPGVREQVVIHATGIPSPDRIGISVTHKFLPA
jgi:hypothetical protein